MKLSNIRFQEREARRELLLAQSRTKTNFNQKKSEDVVEQGHVNFFQELEDGTADQKQINQEHEKEKKEEREKYEKQIGYLTYLGQDAALGKKSWYNLKPDRTISNKEVNIKIKVKEDPLRVMKKYALVGKKAYKFHKDSAKNLEYQSILKGLGTSKSDSKNQSKSHSSDDEIISKLEKQKKKKKKHRHRSSSESSDEKVRIAKEKKIELLRKERLRREKEERIRTEQLLLKITGCKHQDHSKKDGYKLRYNTQFNPNIAKQNYYS